jgi:glutaryl-CoA dehydrogenase
LLLRRAAVQADCKQFNRPFAATQPVQKKLADMQTDVALGLTFS